MGIMISVWVLWHKASLLFKNMPVKSFALHLQHVVLSHQLAPTISYLSVSQLGPGSAPWVELLGEKVIKWDEDTRNRWSNRYCAALNCLQSSAHEHRGGKACLGFPGEFSSQPPVHSSSVTEGGNQWQQPAHTAFSLLLHKTASVYYIWLNWHECYFRVQHLNFILKA